MIAAAAAQAAASAPDYESENPAPPDWQPDPPAAAPKPRPAQAAPQPAPARPGSGTGPSGLTLAESWPVVATQLPLRGMAAELARQAEWVGFEGDTVVLKVAARTLAQGPSVERLRVALAGYFGQAVQLRMEVGETGSGTAHAVAQSEREARQREAEQAIDADPFVQTLLTQFGGEVVPGSIKPA